jgi:hypothetical protein
MSHGSASQNGEKMKATAPWRDAPGGRKERFVLNLVRRISFALTTKLAPDDSPRLL